MRLVCSRSFMTTYIVEQKHLCVELQDDVLNPEVKLSPLISCNRRRRCRERSLSRRRVWIQIIGRSCFGTTMSSSRKIWRATLARASASVNKSTTMTAPRRTEVSDGVFKHKFTWGSNVNYKLLRFEVMELVRSENELNDGLPLNVMQYHILQ